jgi:hypothetical protein
VSDTTPTTPVTGRLPRGVLGFATRHEYLVALSGYALILVILLAPFFFQGKIFAAADFTIPFAPWSHHQPKAAAHLNWIRSDDGISEYPRKLNFHESVQKGDGLPLWESGKLAGYPFYEGMSQTTVFTPLWIWLTVIPPEIFTGLYAFARLLLAGIATYTFARTLKTSKAAAFLAGSVFMLSGPLIVWLSSVLVDVAFAYPALLACVEGYVSDGRKRWIIAIPPIVGWMFMLGHPPSLVHLVSIVSIYAFVRLWQKRRDGAGVTCARLALLVGAAALGIGIGAAGIHTVLTFMALSPHVVRQAALYRLPGQAAMMFVFPNMYGAQAWSTTMLRMPTLAAWGGPSNYCEATGYVGLLPLVLAPLAVWRSRKRPAVRLLAIMAAVFLLGIYTNPLPLNRILAAIPVLQAMTQTRLLLPLALILAVLAAIGMDHLTDPAERPAPGSRVTPILFAAGLAVYGAVLLSVRGISYWVRVITLTTDLTPWDYRTAFLALQSKERITVTVLVLVMTVLLWLVVRGRLSRRVAATALITFAVADALLWGIGFNPMMDKSQVFPTTQSLEELKRLAKGYRVAPFGSKWALGAGDISTVYGIESIGGYDMTGISPLTPMLHAVDPTFYSGGSSIGSSLRTMSRLPSPILDALCVRYLVTDSADTTATHVLERAGYKHVVTSDIAIYENPNYLPRAWSVTTVTGTLNRDIQLNVIRRDAWKPREEAAADMKYAATYSPAVVSVAKWKPGDVTLSVESTGTAFVVLSEMAIPQWGASIDGKAVEAITTDYGFLGAKVPAGRHTVRFRYESPGLVSWGRVSAGFLALWVAVSLAWIGVSRRLARAAAPPPTAGVV